MPALVKWNYTKSVSKMKPLVIRWKTLTDEMLEELYRAREALAQRGPGKIHVRNRTWIGYLEEIGLPRRTAHDWLSQYDAENHKRIETTSNVHFSSATNEWTSPPEIIEKTKELFGVIDLDPCSNNHGQSVAKEVFTKETDGLSQEWHGRVYMNPPYGDEIKGWILKLKSEYESGNVTEAIALVPARPDTEWFRELRSYVRCFVFGRLKFGDQENSAPFPSMLVYLGKNVKQFKEIMSEIGDVYKLYE